jgi:hypothetical protein
VTVRRRGRPYPRALAQMAAKVRAHLANVDCLPLPLTDLIYHRLLLRPERLTNTPLAEQVTTVQRLHRIARAEREMLLPRKQSRRIGHLVRLASTLKFIGLARGHKPGLSLLPVLDCISRIDGPHGNALLLLALGTSSTTITITIAITI